MLPGVGPGPRTCSTRFRSGAYSVNRSAAGPDLPASGHWPGPVLARLTAGPELVADLHRRPGPVLARPNTPWGGWRAALSPGPGPARGHLEQASCGTYAPSARSGVCARSPPRPLRPAPPHHLVRDLPWGEEGGVCMAPAVAGGRFCRNLRIRTRATLGRVRVQAPDLRGHWVYKVLGGMGSALILRLRHAHETGPADKWQTQRSA